MPSILPTYAPPDIDFVRGEGPYLMTESGERYLDFGAGIAVASLGHCHPKLVEALKKQADTLWHTSNMFRIRGQKTLADRLVENSFADGVFFTNSGAEAVEAGLKFARRFQWGEGRPERYRMITFEGCFHGRTIATISTTGEEKLIKGFGPLLDAYDQVPFGDLEAVAAAIGHETAGILIEPVQGEGGIRVASPEFLQGLRKICDDLDLVLMFDEVQCGIGRTGKLFAYEWSGITPDIMAIAKGIGGGFPMGACLVNDKIGKYVTLGSHGTTFGGNPMAMAVGNAVLDVVLEDGFLNNINEISQYLHVKLNEVVNKYHNSLLEEVIGKGLMIGLRTKIDNKDVLMKLRDHKLITVAARSNVIRLLPPLIITKEHADEAVAKIDAACAELSGDGQ